MRIEETIVRKMMKQLVNTNSIFTCRRILFYNLSDFLLFLNTTILEHVCVLSTANQIRAYIVSNFVFYEIVTKKVAHLKTANRQLLPLKIFKTIVCTLLF